MEDVIHSPVIRYRIAHILRQHTEIGLVGDYYAKRWNLFFEAVIMAVKEGKEFDEKAFGEELSKFEHKWTESHTKYPIEPQPVERKIIGLHPNHPTYKAAWAIFERWMN
jgi:hypothetical protein